MSCCPYNITFFAGVTTTTISYPAAFKSAFGQKPRATVYYWDETAQNYYTNNDIPGSQVKFDGDAVIIDHGGPASGYVKIS